MNKDYISSIRVEWNGIDDLQSQSMDLFIKFGKAAFETNFIYKKKRQSTYMDKTKKCPHLLLNYPQQFDFFQPNNRLCWRSYILQTVKK